MKYFFNTYLVTGLGICLGFAVANYFNWGMPDIPAFGSGSGGSWGGGYYYDGYSGRSRGGSWGGGK